MKVVLSSVLRHPTSCASAAEVMSVLFFNTMKYSIKSPRGASNDRFVLSKGHAAPVLYAAWAEAGLFPASDLLNLRKLTSDLEGHPTPVSCSCHRYTGRDSDQLSQNQEFTPVCLNRIQHHTCGNKHLSLTCLVALRA